MLEKLEIQNPSRISHQRIRYEYRWKGYSVWCGATVPAYYHLDYLNDDQYNPHLTNRQFELIGNALTAA